MPVSAISPDLFPAVPTAAPDAVRLSFAGAPAPQPAPQPSPLWPDTVVFSSAPFRLLADLAVTGLHQLATLLPTIERAADDRADSVPLGYLAKAAAGAARQVAEGHEALLAQGPDRVVAALPGAESFRPAAGRPEPALQSLARSVGTTGDETASPRISDELRSATRWLGASAAAQVSYSLDPDPTPTRAHPADPAQRWLAEAKHLLRRTDDALGSAFPAPSLPDPALPDAPVPAPQWAILQVAAARSEIAVALALLDEHAPAATGPTASAPLLARLPAAASLLGLALLLGVAAFATGAWASAAAVAALAGTGVLAWRFRRAAKGVTLSGA